MVLLQLLYVVIGTTARCCKHCDRHTLVTIIAGVCMSDVHLTVWPASGEAAGHVQSGCTDSQGADHSRSNVSQRAGTDPCTTSGPALFWCSAARRSSHTHRLGLLHCFCCCSIHLELSTCWYSTVWKHSHFQIPLENPSIQTHLVLLCCIKRLCIFGHIRPKGATQIRYYYY